MDGGGTDAALSNACVPPERKGGVLPRKNSLPKNPPWTADF
jgi:hypothetical protein